VSYNSHNCEKVVIVYFTASKHKKMTNYHINNRKRNVGRFKLKQRMLTCQLMGSVISVGHNNEIVYQ